MSSESEDTMEAVSADSIRRLKIVFTPGCRFKEMLNSVSVQKLSLGGEASGESEGGSGKPGSEIPEAPEPMV
jgi:hypothetical protein